MDVSEWLQKSLTKKLRQPSQIIRINEQSRVFQPATMSKIKKSPTVSFRTSFLIPVLRVILCLEISDNLINKFHYKYLLLVSAFNPSLWDLQARLRHFWNFQRRQSIPKSEAMCKIRGREKFFRKIVARSKDCAHQELVDQQSSSSSAAELGGLCVLLEEEGVRRSSRDVASGTLRRR